MLVYRSDTQERRSDAAWRDLLRQAADLSGRSSHDDAVALLVTLGEVESAIVDRLFPDRDGLHPLAAALRDASVNAARLVISSERGDRHAAERHAGAVRRSLAAVPVDGIPVTLSISVSEGYAYYALHPGGYADAVQRFLAGGHPRAARVIGIRSIGTSLSAVAAAALEEAGVPAKSWTLRPRGHPFDRRVVLDSALAGELTRDGRGTAYLVVDEGPGLSGSSFAAVVTALTDLGIAPEDIVLFPSWNPDGSSFKSDTARRVWQRHRRCCAGSPPAPPTASSVPFTWRERLYTSEQEWPATHPQHERVKWLDAGGTRIIRFAGLGRYGAATFRRAATLAGHRLGPAPLELRNGYLTMPFVDGRPCTTADASPALIDAVAAHAAATVRLFPSGRRPDVDTLQHMIETNVRLALGDAWLPAAALESDERRPLDEAPCAAIDARMLAHEWIRTREGYVKVDALDHHADHFFPGTQDAGWDLASAAVEFDLAEDGIARLVDAYIRASGDRDVTRRLPFYRRAYLAFRIGYATMAGETLAGTPEAARFDALLHRYHERLMATLEMRRRPKLASAQ